MGDGVIGVLAPWAALGEVAGIKLMTGYVLLEHPPLAATRAEAEPPHQISPVTRPGYLWRKAFLAVRI
ncbi:hypothetical protein SGFS_048240 [Streptomyces graminofaciens]|uniref:Uncharacterized protein n=1 Tax=Streptomyces graminofaciens TaxID=68212 RepID=A0ABN5VLM2_9ACTN|nr:hypothetical protein SGFS_048240 [Streptomyces graminofaciens]